MNTIASPLGRKFAALITAAFLALSAAGCATIEEPAPANGDPAVLAEVPGTDLHRITLTEHAVERVDLKTEVTSVDPQTQKLSVSYWAILYDSAGQTWVYTNPEPRVYVRQAITVERINGSVALLSDGPAAGTAVVTTGAEELYGAEFDTAH
ncbi:hypothetical protein BJG92_02990 [Arthrobacter sp. SO5]|uniref:hypothetical protein n=1 Tax=Arthrobacter sp. SO5 TaxID=1897055 RepID=UPI001E33D61B|nr:hypothetical protein [Arthrobacter sp. SO5]MCB5275441.1 hypothetical protein [Arthrobacter sp. SO5]